MERAFLMSYDLAQYNGRPLPTPPEPEGDPGVWRIAGSHLDHLDDLGRSVLWVLWEWSCASSISTDGFSVTHG